MSRSRNANYILSYQPHIIAGKSASLTPERRCHSVQLGQDQSEGQGKEGKENKGQLKEAQDSANKLGAYKSISRCKSNQSGGLSVAM